MREENPTYQNKWVKYELPYTMKNLNFNLFENKKRMQPEKFSIDML